jgi:hypothetical protein
MRLRLSALPAPIIAVTGFLLSPEFYNLLPDKWAHGVMLLAAAYSMLSPALVTDKPSSKDESKSTKLP